MALSGVTKGHAMKLPRREFLHLAASAVALPAMSRIARAQTYPTRPTTMIVPSPPGGTTDVLARIMAERMKMSLGRSIIDENVSWASGTIGVGRTAGAMPDGYSRETEAEALQAKVLTADEARRIAINVAKLPGLLGRGN